MNKNKKRERERESVNKRIENLTKQIKNTENKLNRDFVGSSHMMRMINNSFRCRYKYCIYNDTPLIERERDDNTRIDLKFAFLYLLRQSDSNGIALCRRGRNGEYRVHKDRLPTVSSPESAHFSGHLGNNAGDVGPRCAPITRRCVVKFK